MNPNKFRLYVFIFDTRQLWRHKLKWIDWITAQSRSSRPPLFNLLTVVNFGSLGHFDYVNILAIRTYLHCSDGI